MANNPKLFVGFCGGSFGSNGVGKTTAANFLVKEYNFHLCNLANPVGEAAKKLCAWNGETAALGLAILNQTCISGRRISENYWLNIAIASIPKDKTAIVFDNLYFKNEADFVRRNGGLIVCIYRVGFKKTDLDFSPDYSVSNDGSITDLEKKIGDLVNKVVQCKQN